MEIVRKGHHYILTGKAGMTRHPLQFIEREPIPNDPPNLRTLRDGVGTDQVLRVLIDRIQHLDEKLPCGENGVMLKHMKAALKADQDRDKRRAEAKVEGTTVQHKTTPRKATKKTAAKAG